MAKTVSDIKIKVSLEGEATFSRLKGQFRALEQTVGVTDKGIQELRRGVLEFGNQSAKSTQLINGQIQALKGLQAQTTINSGTYNKLTRDIEKLNAELGQLDGSVTKVKNNLGSFTVPGYGSEQFASAIQARRKELQGLAVDSQEYLELLTGIRAYERRQGFITGRQEVSAAAAAARRAMPERALAVGLPDTVAGLRQRITELTAEVDHLEIGSDELRRTQQELIGAQRELNEVLGQTSAAYDELQRREDGAIRRAEKLANIQEYYRTQGPLAPGVGGFRDPVTGAMIAGGTRAGIVPLPPPRRGDNIFPISSAVDVMRAGAARQAARPPLGARGYAQVAGAAISGGIFGGPEGFLGGVAGGALGGVGGAFAGAAAGAQVSALRQQLAGTADYAAQISKLQIALRGVAGSQAEYTRAVQAAADVTKTLNVPQDVAIAGMTRLSAAVKGAGGNVTDAELVFKNVTSAIKATGGGAEDVQGAITAMVQVFSKGKVSAEELSGQLGERLPGAVTMFAEANKMSLPELQEALKKGEVGLNELMNFVEALGVRFNKTALDISGSSADAGARLTVAFNDMRLAVGKALQPIGAEFQAAFAKFITDITPAAVEAARKIGEGLKFIIDNASNIAAIAKFAATFALVNLAMKAFIAMNGPISTAFLALQAGFARTSQQAIVAEMRIKAAAASLRAFALAAAAPIVISVAVFGLQTLIQARQELDKIRQRKEKGGAAAAFEGASRETVLGAQKAQKAYLPKIEKAAKDAKKAYEDFQRNPIAQIGASGLANLERLERQYQQKQLELDFTRGVLGLPVPNAPARPERTNFKPPTGEGAGTGTDGKGKKGKEVEDYTKAEADIRIQILEAQREGNTLEQIKAQYSLDVFEANKLNESPEKRRVALAEAYNKMLVDTEAIFDDLVDRRKEMAKLDQDLNKELEDRAYRLGIVNEKDYTNILLLRERQRLEETYRGLPDAQARIAAGAELYRREIDPTFREAGETEVARMQQDLEKMLKPINQLKEGAQAFGSAFSAAFTSVVTGSQSADQAMAQFLQNLGQYFIDYAAKLITQMIAIATIQAIIKALGGPSTGGGGGVEQFNASVSQYTPNAKGNVFNKGLKRYAMGGIVNKPTMFKYADGGTGSFGLMGEAGPEAIIPLRRGPDGRLGVSAYFADSRAALGNRSAGAGASAFDENRMSMEGAATIERERRMERLITSGAGSTEIRYSRVGSGDLPFVTEEDMLQATRVAAQEGARLGQARTLAALKNNPGARRSIGI